MCSVQIPMSGVLVLVQNAGEIWKAFDSHSIQPWFVLSIARIKVELSGIFLSSHGRSESVFLRSLYYRRPPVVVTWHCLNVVVSQFAHSNENRNHQHKTFALGLIEASSPSQNRIWPERVRMKRIRLDYIILIEEWDSSHIFFRLLVDRIYLHWIKMRYSGYHLDILMDHWDHWHPKWKIEYLIHLI